MAVSYVTVYLPGSPTPLQVVEGSQLHLIYVSMGATSTPSTPPATRRPDPFPQYIDADELAAALAGLGAGGGGAVDSVNGKTGTVVLGADDIADSTTRKLMTSDERNKLDGISPGANVYTDEQVRDTIGATLVGGPNVTVTPDDAANTITISATSGGGGSSAVGGVALDSFAGATDEDKLTAALAYAAAQTVKPPIVFGNRRYNFSQIGRTVFSGMKLTGGYGHGNQQRSADSIPNDIRFTGAGTWWNLGSASVFDVGLYGLSFQGNSGAQFMAGGTSVLWTSVFRDLGFNLWKHVLGNPTTKLLNTAVLFDGWWNINNSYNTAITLGGSDSNLFMDGMLIDAEPATMAAGKYHMILDYQEKSSVGPIFMTADQNGGLLIEGNEGRGPLTFFGQGRIEGRNKDTPSYGSNVRINGGHASFRDWWFSYGATALNTQGRTGEGGVITMTGGRVLLDGCMYSRATGVAETVPWIYQTGGNLRVRNAWTSNFGGTWTGLPRVRGLGGTRSVDDSVTVVTV